MVSLIKTQEEYKNWLSRVSHLFKQSQIKASMKVNSEMLRFYWLLGMDIKSLDLDGYSVAELLIKVSHDLQNIFPDVHVFSKTNLWYMLKFYELYAPILKIPQVGECHLMQKITIPQVGEFSIENIFCIPWGHTKLIIDKCRKDSKKAIYYTMKVLENNWSRAILMNFIDSNLYEREGKAITNFNTTLPEAQGELAQALTKDPYNFDFLTLSQRYNEKELKDALMDNITRFLLELGNGFAFVGREVRLEVGEKEKFVDMLFYNIKLHCYVVLEVKINEFDSSYAGQLSSYVVAVNHQLKGQNDNPTIGLLVCKSLDKVEAQYALEATSQPIGISGYELYKLLPENFKGTLPSIEEIEAELGEDTNE